MLKYLFIGPCKCATCSVYSFLQKHPDIAASEIKEPFEQLRKVHKKHPSLFTSADFKDYFDYWKYTSDHVLMDASSSLVIWPNVSQIIRNLMQQETYAIFLLRNPVDYIRSHILFSEARYPGDITSILDVDDHVAYIRKRYDQFNFLAMYEKYLYLVDKERIFFTYIDDFHSRIQELCTFLEIDDTFQSQSFPKINTTISYYSRDLRKYKRFHDIFDLNYRVAFYDKMLQDLLVFKEVTGLDLIDRYSLL